MLKNKIILFFGLVLLFATSCKDDNLAPIATFDQSEKGAYVALISETARDINLFDIASSSYTYTVEFIDLEKGALVSEYALQLVYEDADPSDGDNSAGPVDFRSFAASEFETNENGNKGISNISITATEAMAAVGITDLGPGDVLKFVGSVTTVEGATYTASNSSASVNGAAFRGHFNFSLRGVCPSELAGDYAYRTVVNSAVCPNGSTNADEITGMVTMNALGGGEYWFSDWSFGAYTVCYGATSVADQEGLTFLDICNEVSFNKNVDSFGDTWTWESTIEGEEWTITWSNTYGEGGSSVLVKPGGWGLTIK